MRVLPPTKPHIPDELLQPCDCGCQAQIAALQAQVEALAGALREADQVLCDSMTFYAPDMAENELGAARKRAADSGGVLAYIAVCRKRLRDALASPPIAAIAERREAERAVLALCPEIAETIKLMAYTGRTQAEQQFVLAVHALAAVEQP